VHYVEVSGPYDFALSLKRLVDLPRQVVTRIDPGPVYVRALEQDGRLGLVRVSDGGPGRLAVAIEGDLDPRATVAAVRRAFGLDVDLAGFRTHMETADPVMASLARRFPGARPVGAFDLWESLAFSIIAQQITMSFAFTLKEGLISLCGGFYGGMPAFPAPEKVAALEYEQLQALKYSRRKAEYVIDAARAIIRGELDLEAIVKLPFEPAVQRLVELRGVGRWTAECVLMEAGVGEAFPAGDIGVRNAVQRFYGLDHQPTEAEVRSLGACWDPHSALACYYLWLGLLDKGGGP